MRTRRIAASVFGLMVAVAFPILGGAMCSGLDLLGLGSSSPRTFPPTPSQYYSWRDGTGGTAGVGGTGGTGGTGVSSLNVSYLNGVWRGTFTPDDLLDYGTSVPAGSLRDFPVTIGVPIEVSFQTTQQYPTLLPCGQTGAGQYSKSYILSNISVGKGLFTSDPMGSSGNSWYGKFEPTEISGGCDAEYIGFDINNNGNEKLRLMAGVSISGDIFDGLSYMPNTQNQGIFQGDGMIIVIVKTSEPYYGGYKEVKVSGTWSLTFSPQ